MKFAEAGYRISGQISIRCNPRSRTCSKISLEVETKVLAALQAQANSEFEDLLLRTMVCLSDVMNDIILELDAIKTETQEMDDFDYQDDDTDAVEHVKIESNGDVEIESDKPPPTNRPAASVKVEQTLDHKSPLNEQKDMKVSELTEDLPAINRVTNKQSFSSKTSKSKLSSEETAKRRIAKEERAERSKKRRDENAAAAAGTLICEECGQSMDSRETLQKHRKAHKRSEMKKKKLFCPKCGKGFHSCQRDFERHLRSHQRQEMLDKVTKEGGSFNCEACSKDFVSLSLYSFHLRSCPGALACPTCPFLKFETPEELAEHNRSHDTQCCELCGEVIRGDSATALAKHMGRKDHAIYFSQIFTCSSCGQGFTKEESFEKHKRLGQAGGEHTCSYENCDRSFQLKCGLSKHKRNDHGHDKYICEYPGCNGTFSQWSGFQVHKRIHTGERPFKCDECDSAFITKWKLSHHKKRHYGIREYQCNQCDKAFFNKYKLDRHIRIHTGERPFSCDKCAKTFIQKKDLKNHQKTPCVT